MKDRGLFNFFINRIVLIILCIIIYSQISLAQVEIQQKIILNEPISWIQEVYDKSDSVDINVDLPKNAYNIEAFSYKNKTKKEIYGYTNNGFMNINTTTPSSLQSIKNDNQSFSIKILIEKKEPIVIKYKTPFPKVSTKSVNNSTSVFVTHDYTELSDVPIRISFNKSIGNKFLNIINLKTKEKISDYKLLDTNNDGSIDSLEWVSPKVSKEEYEVSLEVIDPLTYLRSGDTWVVRFNTTGTSNLVITPLNASWTEFIIDNAKHTDDPLIFLDITCNDTSIKNNLQIKLKDGSTKSYTSLTPQDSLQAMALIIPSYSCSGLGKTSNSIISNNEINTYGVDGYGIYLSLNTSNNTLINNNIFSNQSYEIYHEFNTSDDHINYLIYNNSYGEIRWTNTSENGFLQNLTLDLNNNQGLGLVRNIYIGDNAVSLNTSAFTILRINSSADIIMKGLIFNSITHIFKNSSYITSTNAISGPNCTGCQQISYSGGIFKFNTTSFSSFKVNGT